MEDFIDLVSALPHAIIEAHGETRMIRHDFPSSIQFVVESISQLRHALMDAECADHTSVIIYVPHHRLTLDDTVYIFRAEDDVIDDITINYNLINTSTSLVPTTVRPVHTLDDLLHKYNLRYMQHPYAALRSYMSLQMMMDYPGLDISKRLIDDAHGQPTVLCEATLGGLYYLFNSIHDMDMYIGTMDVSVDMQFKMLLVPDNKLSVGTMTYHLPMRDLTGHRLDTDWKLFTLRMSICNIDPSTIYIVRDLRVMSDFTRDIRSLFK